MLGLSTILFLIAGSILVMIHIISLELSLYWKYLWLDIPVHALGGSVLALCFFALHDVFPRFPKRLLYPIPVLLLILLISLGWEVYEIGIGIPIEADFEIDTSIDLIMAMLGGVVGYVVGYSVSALDIELT
ncbi:hypothetical protein N8083_01070 [Candidatus Pacebacteria bacterium]|nr:hypothetical protein [Candidatus Paceibacterota bacterium]